VLNNVTELVVVMTITIKGMSDLAGYIAKFG
jgi:hypothetical protein